MPRKDQYGRRVPKLAALDYSDDPETVEQALTLPWYIVEGHSRGFAILVPRHEAWRKHVDTSEVELRPSERVLRVAEPLKRYSEEDGFYNA